MRTSTYEPEFKKQIVGLHLEEGGTLASLQEEYNISKASISNWVSQFRKECQTSPEDKENYNMMKENLQHRI